MSKEILIGNERKRIAKTGYEQGAPPGRNVRSWLYRYAVPLEETVDAAMLQCVEEGLLVSYLSVKRSEVLDMILEEYDEETTMAAFKEEGREEGREEERRNFLRRVCAIVEDGSMSLTAAAAAFGFTEEQIRSAM